MTDCLIIGGGVIGLSLAYELAAKGRSVRVVDRGPPEHSASWAAAGILPPALFPPGDGPLDQLWALSWRLHREWAERLREQTGIDNGYNRCGGLHLADTAAEAAELPKLAARWRRGNIAAELLEPLAVAELEPALRGAVESGLMRAALLLPDESQIRNPRHLKALRAACIARGVEISSGVEVDEFEMSGGRIVAARTREGSIRADAFAVTSGTWSDKLLERLGVRPAIKPIRGQMVLLAVPRPILRRVMYVGPHYFAPRDDGRMLVGSTVEDVGFDRRVTAFAVGELLEFARRWIPELQSAQFECSWAGLRPQSASGSPYLGRVPGLENAFVAAGHFRSGLSLSPGTAVVMAQLICGAAPAIDLEPFRVSLAREGARGD